MCNENHEGFDIEALRDRTPPYRKSGQKGQPTDTEYKQNIYDETLRLLSETLIAARSKHFVGTRLSNIGWMVRALHTHPDRCVLLRPDQKAHPDTFLQPSHRPKEETPVTPVDPHPHNKEALPAKAASFPFEAIQPMEIARIDGESYYLFFDIFVHWSGTKLTATAPYYGDDIDWAHHEVDLNNVVLTARDFCVTAQYIPHRLDAWEPAILFDFESPELLALIKRGKPFDVTISVGPHKQTFTIHPRTETQYPVAMSLLIRDENRWIKYFLDYYLLCLHVSHVFVYDNFTSDSGRLKGIISPYIRLGKVTYIPWHVQRRQHVCKKHIAQTVQESHTLNRYGRTPWIGFFDIDEFLRIPGKTLPEFLKDYDPDKTDGLSFGLRWFMYKGDLDFEAIGNPLLSYFHSKPDPLGRKRQKLIVSARHVRFLRLHWLEEGKQDTQVTDPDVFFHHYYLRPDRFEDGKKEVCTDYDAYMLQLQPLLERGFTQETPTTDKKSIQAGRTSITSREMAIAHVKNAFQRADNQESKLKPDLLGIEGMCGEKTRHLLNNLCDFDECKYIEIHTLAAASLCSAMYGNKLSATAFENWSRFGGPTEPFYEDIKACTGAAPPTIVQKAFSGVDINTLQTCNVFYYGNYHRNQSEYQAIKYFAPLFEPYTLLVIEDWNRNKVREGVRNALSELGLKLVYDSEVILPPEGVHGMPRHKGAKTWWNGIFLALVEKKGPVECHPHVASNQPDLMPHSNHLPIEIVIFSKDRACQLDALLRSMDQFVRIDHRKTVLYTSSTNDFDRAYEKVSADHPGVAFVKETAFKDDLLTILKPAEQEDRHIMFLVDDILFTRTYTGGENLFVFNDSEDIATVSLRLGENITYCHPLDCNTVPHDFSKSNTWRWKEVHRGYWDYPMSVDGNIFRASDIVSLLEKLRFSNPNTLEGVLSCNPIKKPFMLAEREPYLVNLALNRVQDVWDNPYGDISAEQLNTAYLNGERIDIRPIVNGTYTSCHITPEIRFMRQCGVDHIYCINLDHRTDRWQSMALQFHEQGLVVERFPALQGSPDDPNPRGLNKGELGCLKSRSAVLRDAKFRGFRKILLLDDDAVLCPRFSDRLRERLKEVPPDWQTLYIGGIVFRLEDKPIPVSEHIHRNVRTYGTVGMVLNESVYEAAIELYDSHTLAADNCHAHVLQSQGHCYINMPFLAHVTRGPSDVSDEGFTPEHVYDLARQYYKD